MSILISIHKLIWITILWSGDWRLDDLFTIEAVQIFSASIELTPNFCFWDFLCLIWISPMGNHFQQLWIQPKKLSQITTLQRESTGNTFFYHVQITTYYLNSCENISYKKMLLKSKRKGTEEHFTHDKFSFK